MQAGDIENRGVELGVNFNTDVIKGLHWDTSITYSRNVNEIKKLIICFGGWPYGLVVGCYE